MARSHAPARQAPAEQPATRPAPHERTRTFPGLLEASKAELLKLIREPEMVERFARIALTEFRKDKALAKCTPESIMASVMDAARLNLEIGGPMRQGYLIPYGDTCTFEPSYIGLLELARRSGMFRVIAAEVVRERDDFHYERDSIARDGRPRFYHRPELDHPGEVRGAYVHAFLANGEPMFLYMRRAEIEDARAASRAPHSLMWKTFFGEGARKTVLKRFLKTEAKSIELAEALAMGERDDLDDVAPAPRPVPRRGLAGLGGRLGLDDRSLPPQGTRTYSESDDPAPDPDPHAAEEASQEPPGDAPGDGGEGWTEGRE